MESVKTKETKDESHIQTDKMMGSIVSARGNKGKTKNNLESSNFDLIFNQNDIESAFKRNIRKDGT